MKSEFGGDQRQNGAPNAHLMEWIIGFWLASLAWSTD
jgi:hypothetical protein